MAAEEENNKKNEGKGFAGLSSLVSDVDTTPSSPAPKTESAGSTTSSGRPASQSAQPQPQQPTQRQAYTRASATVVWLVWRQVVAGPGCRRWPALAHRPVQQAHREASPAPAYSPPAQSAAPSYSPPAQPQAPSGAHKNQSRQLVRVRITTARLGIAWRRTSAWRARRPLSTTTATPMWISSTPWWLTTTAAVAVSAIEAAHWRARAAMSSRTEANFRQKAGADSLGRPSTGSLPAPAPARPAPDATVQLTQRKLNELGYDAGSADGLMGTQTRSAILEFQRDSGLTADGLPTSSLLRRLSGMIVSLLCKKALR